MHTLLKAFLWNIVIFAFWLIYYSALEVCKQVEVIAVLVCRDHWPENDQAPINMQK